MLSDVVGSGLRSAAHREALVARGLAAAVTLSLAHTVVSALQAVQAVCAGSRWAGRVRLLLLLSLSLLPCTAAAGGAGGAAMQRTEDQALGCARLTGTHAYAHAHTHARRGLLWFVCLPITHVIDVPDSLMEVLSALLLVAAINHAVIYASRLSLS